MTNQSDKKLPTTDLCKDLFEHNCEAVLVINPENNRIEFHNLAAQKLLPIDQSFDQISVTTLFKPSIDKLIVLTQETLHKGHAISLNLKLASSLNQTRELEASSTLLTQYKTPLIALTLRDNKHFKKMTVLAEVSRFQKNNTHHWKTIDSIFQEFERENQLILNAAGEGIYGVDHNGNATFFNPAAERLLGWTAPEVIGKNMHAVIHHTHQDGNEYHCEDCPIYAAFKDGKVRQVDHEQFWKKDGTAIDVEYTSTPILDNGQLAGAVVIFRDISERKKAELQLHAALEEVQQLKKKLELENAYLQEEFRTEHNYKEIVGQSAAIQTITQQIDLVAPTDANVLINGESGTGKELIARAIHESSHRQNRPMIRVNCAAIPNDLFESEFFGHIKGAFTGATNDRAGRFELADGGSLFLDEVGEIPMELQSKLLRVLQDHQFERLGDSKTRKVDVRIIAATNQDLKQAVTHKQFREDLYFRLNVFPIESAPLRERREDIPLLANHFLKLACQKFAKPSIKLTVKDIQAMQSYGWPGNIRELINIIERAVILSSGKRLKLNLPTHPPSSTLWQGFAETSVNAIKTKEDLIAEEKNNIISALKACNGKIFGDDGAAQMLNLKPTTLTSKLKRWKINRHQFIQM